MTCEYLFALVSTAISVRASFAIDVAHVVSNDGIDRDKLTFWRFSTVERGLKISKYWSSNCQQCPLKGDCTPGPQRRVTRWEHESVLDEMQARLDHAPEMMRIRRQTVEHPFGTIKAWMGATHCQTRTIERVSTERSFVSAARWPAVRAIHASRINTLGASPVAPWPPGERFAADPATTRRIRSHTTRQSCSTSPRPTRRRCRWARRGRVSFKRRTAVC
jgi:Transposase DDE domain